jgi:hypothetical protein
MKLNLKNYQILKTKQYLKENNFIFFSIGANQSAQNWITTEQGLHKLKLNYHKIYNNIAIKVTKKSIYKNSLNMISSTFFFIKPSGNQLLNKKILINELNSVRFNLLAVKLNKKVYSISQTKSMSSFNYKTNISVMYQFLITNLKSSYRLSQKN